MDAYSLNTHDLAILDAFRLNGTPFSKSRVRAIFTKDEEKEDELEGAELKKFKQEDGQKKHAKQLEQFCKQQQEQQEQHDRQEKQNQQDQQKQQEKTSMPG